MIQARDGETDEDRAARRAVDRERHTEVRMMMMMVMMQDDAK